MASRRVRIKGIANIPQRRKPGTVPDGEPVASESVPAVQPEVHTELHNLEPAAAEHVIEEVKIDLKETQLPISNNASNKSSPLTSVTPDNQSAVTKLPKPQHLDGTKCGSDIEHPPPAASPSKFLNRSRIKAIPRLNNQRRTSFSVGSASESEDETKKTHNRIRNDSVCSVASVAESTTANDSLPIKKEIGTVVQRKYRRTEQARKIAEARRDFAQKCSNGTPDRQKLTMMDLIFYSPATAPMSQKPKSRTVTESETTNSKVTAEEQEEEVDNPADEEATKSDEENTIPAPQIKIGANGEIIVDELSLVIENKETKKSREALQKTALVDGNFDTGYGIYKRTKRTKYWSPADTLRFYKAINTIGTDFTLMCELFPDRSRRDLKMKFKKEERQNRSLIDKAIMQPLHFDMTELRIDLEKVELEKRMKEKHKQELEEKMLLAAQNGGVRKKKRGAGSYIHQEIALEDPKIKRVKVTPQAPKETSVVSSRQKVIKMGINSILDSDSDNESDMSQQSSVVKAENTVEEARKQSEEIRKQNSTDSEEESVCKTQTTRSGRLSKPPEKLKADASKPNEIIVISTTGLSPKAETQVLSDREDINSVAECDVRRKSNDSIGSNGDYIDEILPDSKDCLDVSRLDKTIKLDTEGCDALIDAVLPECDQIMGNQGDAMMPDTSKSEFAAVPGMNNFGSSYHYGPEHANKAPEDRRIEEAQASINARLTCSESITIDLPKQENSVGNATPLKYADSTSSGFIEIKVNEIEESETKRESIIDEQNAVSREQALKTKERYESRNGKRGMEASNSEQALNIKRRRLSDYSPSGQLIPNSPVIASTENNANEIEHEIYTANSDSENESLNNGESVDKTSPSEQLIPGSIMIETKENDEGEAVHEVYTVNAEGQKVKIELSPEMLESLTQNEENDSAQQENIEDYDLEPLDLSKDQKLEQSNNFIVVNDEIDNDRVDQNVVVDFEATSDIIIQEDRIIIPFDEFDVPGMEIEIQS